MTKFTLAQIKAKINRETDLEDEVFVEEDELTDYINEAIDEAEATIIGLYEDYFLTNEYMDIVSGTSEYELPSDIYANKIRRVVYDDGSADYPIKRIKEFEKIPYAENTDNLAYVITNDSTNGYRIKFYPSPDFTSDTTILIWYIRNATRLSATTDTCDIPEFINFIYAYTIYKIYKKEQFGNGAMMALAKDDLDRERALMTSTLSNRVDDEDNFIIADTSLLEEHI